MNELIANDKVVNNLIDDKMPIRIIISSLSLGGAEKIVVDWASSEASRGRDVEVAVIHTKDKEHKFTSSNVKLLRRSSKSKVSDYLNALKDRWGSEIAVSTHLLDLQMHEYLWSLNFMTVPVIHNDSKGWKINPMDLNHPNVPIIVACAKYVKSQLIEAGYKGDVKVVRHLPLINNKMIDFDKREKLRKDFHISKDTVVIGAVGAIKSQKNYHRLVDIASKTNKNVLFLVFGDYVNKEGKILKENLIEKIEQLGLLNRVVLMGFKADISNYYPIFDGVLNCSNYEGYSIATQEALLSGVPVVATAVSGQPEITLNGLTLLDINEKDQSFSDEINKIPTRKEINPIKVLNSSRIWSLTTVFTEKVSNVDTMFLTANLNAGGAQRSLINLTTNLKQSGENISVAVCNNSSNSYFSDKLIEANVPLVQLSESRDVFDLTIVLLKEIQRKDIKKLVLWNADPKMKLLLAEFLPDGVLYYDVSPGAYAFEELANTKDFQQGTTLVPKDFYDRLDCLVLKYDADTSLIESYDVKTKVIRNGVEDWSADKVYNQDSRNILVSGRLVESKHILSILKSFKEFNVDGEYTLHFYGQAEERNQEYLKKINELAKDQKVVFNGSDPYLSFMKKDFAMTIVLGTHQGCPNAVLESASGLIPIIANDSGGTREIVKDGESGILIPNEFTNNELVEALNKMKQKNRVDFVSKAKEIVELEFSIEKMRENYSNLFA